MNMRALVTGSSGFVGAVLSQKLLDLEWEVLGIDSENDYYSPMLKRIRRANLEKYPKFRFVNSDVSNLLDLSSLVENYQPRYIFHLAAQAGVRIPVSQQNRYVTSNLVGFSNILQIAIEQSIPNFLYASSSSVYGDDSKIPYSEKEGNLKPNSFYGATKLSNEILSASVAANSGIRIRGLRFFTVYGPKGRPDMAYLRIISSLANGSKFELFGDGSVERDFTFIDDCVEMMYSLGLELERHQNNYNDVVNIGGGYPLSMNRLIEISENLIGKKLSYISGPKNPKDVKKTMADPSYLIELIGKKPMTTLETGIKQTIEWATTDSISSNLRGWVESSE